MTSEMVERLGSNIQDGEFVDLVYDQMLQRQRALYASKVVDAPEDKMIKEICEEIGYGAVIDSACRQWAKKDPMGAFYVGGCLAFRPSKATKGEQQ